MTDDKKIEITLMEKVTIYTPKDFINSAHMVSIQNALKKDFDSNKKIAFNLKNVQTVSSSIIGAFIRIAKQMETYGNKFTLLEISEHMKEVLKDTNLDLIFKVYETESEFFDEE